MTFKAALLLCIGILLGIPVLAYFTVWWGVAAFYRAKAYAKQYELKKNNNDDDNSNSNKMTQLN